MSGMSGAERFAKRFKAAPAHVQRMVYEANLKSAEELARLARVLIPVDTGRSRASITASEVEPGVAKVDFGPLSRVLEGGRQAGVSKKGHPYPAMSPRPFVNPALRLIRKKRRAALKRALARGLKANGGG